MMAPNGGESFWNLSYLAFDAWAFKNTRTKCSIAETALYKNAGHLILIYGKNREQTRQLVLYVFEKASDVVVTTSCWVVVVQ